jgi:hypothetical protein
MAEATPDRYAITMIIGDDAMSTLGHEGLRGYLAFEIRNQVRRAGYTPLDGGEVHASWVQLHEQDAPHWAGEPVFTLGDVRDEAVAGDWVARAWVKLR